MDVRTWLGGVDLGDGEATLPEKLGIPDFLRPKIKEVEKPRTRRKLQRSRSDDSLLEIAAIEKPKGRKTKRKHDEQSSSETQSLMSQKSFESQSQTSESLDDYTKRPRRRTRSDRYDPKPREQRRRKHEGHRKKDRKGEKRKLKHATDKRLSDMVTSYRAKNVPRPRLTVGRSVV